MGVPLCKHSLGCWGELYPRIELSRPRPSSRRAPPPSRLPVVFSSSLPSSSHSLAVLASASSASSSSRAPPPSRLPMVFSSSSPSSSHSHPSPLAVLASEPWCTAAPAAPRAPARGRARRPARARLPQGAQQRWIGRIGLARVRDKDLSDACEADPSCPPLLLPPASVALGQRPGHRWSRPAQPAAPLRPAQPAAPLRLARQEPAAPRAAAMTEPAQSAVPRSAGAPIARSALALQPRSLVHRHPHSPPPSLSSPPRS